MTAALVNELSSAPDWSTKWAWIKTFILGSKHHDKANMLQRTTQSNSSVAFVTEFQREVSELALAAQRESTRRRAEAKALHRAGIEQMRQAEALESQAEYYSQLIR